MTARASLLGLALLVACSSSSRDAEPPTGDVRFPAADAQTDAAEITVSGTASDDVAVATVRVNDRDAVSDDRFQTWRATIPLQRGTNALRVEVTDLAGKSTVLADVPSIERVGSLLAAPNSVVIVVDRAYLTDSALDAVIAVDLSTGAREVVSGASRGIGPLFDSPAGTAADCLING